VGVAVFVGFMGCLIIWILFCCNLCNFLLHSYVCTKNQKSVDGYIILGGVMNWVVFGFFGSCLVSI
jgi:hypothetical protein